MKPWPEMRRREYAALAELVRLVRSLDSESGWMAKIARAVAIADALSRDDLSRLRIGFMTWLHRRATGAPMYGDTKEPAPVRWAVTYMGEFADTDVYASEKKAQDAMDFRNKRYPQGAAHRRVVPLYAAPLTQEDEA